MGWAQDFFVVYIFASANKVGFLSVFDGRVMLLLRFQV